MGALDALFEWCDRELSTEKTRAEFEAARRRLPGLEPLATSREALDLLEHRRAGPPDATFYERRDRLVLAILTEHQRDQGAHWPRALLLLSFARTLRSFRGRFAWADAGDHDDRDREAANRLIEAFLDAARAYPVDRRSEKVPLNLVRETEKLLCRRITVDRRRAELETEATPDAVSPYERAARNVRASDLHEDDRDDAARALDLLVERGVIAEVERHLILGANVHGRELKAWLASAPAELEGLGYEAAKKRLARALRKIREHLADAGLELSDLLDPEK